MTKEKILTRLALARHELIKLAPLAWTDKRKDDLMRDVEAIKEVEALILGPWISVSDRYPDPRERVFVICEKERYDGKIIRLKTIAEYIPAMTIPETEYLAEEFCGDGQYNYRDGEYYAPKGWYEHQIEPEIKWKLSAKVTHWMPLPELPELR